MLSDTLFSDASWLFFAICSVAIATISIAAFGPDLFRPRATATSARTPPGAAIHENDTHGV